MVDITRAEHQRAGSAAADLRLKEARVRELLEAIVDERQRTEAVARPEPTPWSRTPEGFACANGGDPVREGPYLLFGTGARIEDHGSGLYRLFDPPADDLERLRLQRRYHAELYRRAADEFGKLKAALLNEPGAVYTLSDSVRRRFGLRPEDVDGEGLRLAEAFVAFATRHADELAAIDAEIARHPRTLAEAAEAERRREVDARAAAYRAEKERQVRALQLPNIGAAGQE